jgi:hypothetical protein
MCVFLFSEMMLCVLLCLLLSLYTSHTIVYTNIFVVVLRLYAKH